MSGSHSLTRCPAPIQAGRAARPRPGEAAIDGGDRVRQLTAATERRPSAATERRLCPNVSPVPGRTGTRVTKGHTHTVEVEVDVEVRVWVWAWA